MAKDNVITAIDVGTTKVCTLVGEINRDDEVQIIGVGTAASRGLRKGMVVDIDETVEAIRESVEAAERSGGHKIVSAHVGIAGGHISSVNNRGVVATSRSDRVITPEDVSRAMDSARTVNIPSNREIIHVIPRSYTIDGQEGVRNPLGMYGFRLDLEAHIVTGAVTSIQNLTKCIQKVGIEVAGMVLQPIASSEAILTEEEKELGVIIADMGGGTTDIGVFIEGAIWHTAVLPVAGYHISNDIAIGLRTPFAVAEDIKGQHGHALPDSVDAEEKIDIATFGANGHRSVSVRQLSEIIHARVEEILGMILVEIKRCGYDGLLPAGLVLTGGTANLHGMEALARDVTQLPVRIGRPNALQGLVDSLNDPAYATSVGLLLWGMRNEATNNRPRHYGQHFGTAYRRLIDWLKELLP
ncbi:MAG: cell division protein FtsA [Chloroflexi bacterium]|nr:cell division protein FtsA [Chloroflexota bacterium]